MSEEKNKNTFLERNYKFSKSGHSKKEVSVSNLYERRNTIWHNAQIGNKPW
jgi:hypothetical protein